MEIERKFLVRSDDFLSQATRRMRIRQVYLASSSLNTVRVRITDHKAYITIKGSSDDNGLSRPEWEYLIPVQDAEEMLHYAQPGLIEKVRYYVPYERFIWEVDVFSGKLEGLIIAEVELSSTDDRPALPSWVGREVTGDQRYYNAVLSATNQMPPTE